MRIFFNSPSNALLWFLYTFYFRIKERATGLKIAADDVNCIVSAVRNSKGWTADIFFKISVKFSDFITFKEKLLKMRLDIMQFNFLLTFNIIPQHK